MINTRAACGLLAFLCMGLAMSGCVHTPTRAEMVDEIKGYTLPADVVKGKGLIYIIYSSDPLTPLELEPNTYVLLDGDDDDAVVGHLGTGRYIYCYVQPGHHRVKLPRWTFRELIVEVEEGEILFIKTLHRYHRVIEEVDGVIGRYYLKYSQPGERTSSAEH